MLRSGLGLNIFYLRSYIKCITWSVINFFLDKIRNARSKEVQIGKIFANLIFLSPPDLVLIKISDLVFTANFDFLI